MRTRNRKETVACQCGGVCRPPSGMDWQPESRRFTCPKCGRTLAPGDHRLLALMRQWTGVDQPRLHHLPQWFKRLVIGKFRDRLGYGCHGASSSFAVQDFLWNRALGPSLMDHWGSLTTPAGVRQFVLEPYVEASTIKRFHSFAGELDIDTEISPRSWWFPGATIRLAFIDPETAQHAEQA